MHRLSTDPATIITPRRSSSKRPNCSLRILSQISLPVGWMFVIRIRNCSPIDCKLTYQKVSLNLGLIMFFFNFKLLFCKDKYDVSGGIVKVALVMLETVLQEETTIEDGMNESNVSTEGDDFYAWEKKNQQRYLVRPRSLPFLYFRSSSIFLLSYIFYI